MALHKARTKAKDEGCDISGQYERDSSADYEKQAFGSSVFSVAWGGKVPSGRPPFPRYVQRKGHRLACPR